MKETWAKNLCQKLVPVRFFTKFTTFKTTLELRGVGCRLKQNYQFSVGVCLEIKLGTRNPYSMKSCLKAASLWDEGKMLPRAVNPGDLSVLKLISRAIRMCHTGWVVPGLRVRWNFCNKVWLFYFSLSAYGSMKVSQKLWHLQKLSQDLENAGSVVLPEVFSAWKG